MFFLLTGVVWEVLSVFGGFFALYYFYDKYAGKEKPVWYEDRMQRITWFVTVECHLVAGLLLLLGILF